MADGTLLKGTYVMMDGPVVDANHQIALMSDDFYYTVADKCTVRQGFHEEPQSS